VRIVAATNADHVPPCSPSAAARPDR
jgi:hypothetical protein